MWIHNCSKVHLILGKHPHPGQGGVLIQITDPEDEYALPKHSFDHVYRFAFHDLHCGLDESDWTKATPVSSSQAQHLVEILQWTRCAQGNIVVQCPVGLARSGAVVEVAQLLGFEATDAFRVPSLPLRYAMLEHL
jgi:protein-tyrosine phosphatase